MLAGRRNRSGVRRLVRQKPHGYKKAERELKGALQMPANTIEGMRAKIRCAQVWGRHGIECISGKLRGGNGTAAQRQNGGRRNVTCKKREPRQQPIEPRRLSPQRADLHSGFSRRTGDGDSCSEEGAQAHALATQLHDKTEDALIVLRLAMCRSLWTSSPNRSQRRSARTLSY